MNFIEKLKEKAKENNSIVCMGMDPLLKRIPLQGNPEEVITKFYFDILERMIKENIKPAIVKPNIAFYEQYGFEGLRALKTLIQKYQEAGIPVLLDAKRGDIGKTSMAYAKSLFEFWGADAITIAPYMGSDSIDPFTDWCEQGKGVYVLVKTSNKGAVDLQNLKVENTPIYMKTAEKLAGEWHKTGIGSVIGATYPQELEEISRFFVDSGKQIPMLIPGVGAQGGTAQDVVNVLKKTNNPLAIHRINSSSGINYAYEKENSSDYAGAAVRAIEKLNKEINFQG
ncbi:orotidine-5'-phosphate decarboxylase [Candidatus Woesearchaeota archaeon]|nr:orotidine-5'-phosphate decarboxylase [Candidatus Woesearchaeota archaeon]